MTGAPRGWRAAGLRQSDPQHLRCYPIGGRDGVREYPTAEGCNYADFHGAHDIDTQLRSSPQVVNGVMDANEYDGKLPGPVEYFYAYNGVYEFKDAVSVDLRFTELTKVDEGEGTFDASFKITLEWYDPAYDTVEWEDRKRRTKGEIKVVSYCAPELTIEDVIEGNDG